MLEGGGEEQALEIFEGFVQARGWGGETEEVSASEKFGFRHEAGGASSRLVEKVVPRVDVVLLEGGESLQYVVGGRMRLGVEECPSFIYGWFCGGGERVGHLAAGILPRWAER